jgi:hypothetical protein
MARDPIGLLAGLRAYGYPKAPETLVDPSGQSRFAGVDFANSPDLYPTGPGERNIVEIPMQGSRDRDFVQATKEAGMKAQPEGYTWHHLDDFNPETGTTTMQLVKTEAHEAMFPHSGSVSQFEQHFGIKYDTQDAVLKSNEKGWLRGRNPRGCKGGG